MPLSYRTDYGIAIPEGTTMLHYVKNLSYNNVLTNHKRKFVKYLFAAAVILLVANIAVDFFRKPKNETSISELTTSQIETVFFRVLDEYGIEPVWITKKKVKLTGEDSISSQYFVKIPADVPAPLIIKEINKTIEKDITGFVSEEKKIFGSTEIRIYSNEILKLKAVLQPDKQIFRSRNELSFIIYDAFDLSQNNFNNFLSVHYQLAAVVVPGHEVIAKADSLKKYSKEFIVLLNDENGDSKMKLKQEYQKEILRGSIKNIVSSFKNAAAFVVDKKSLLFNSPIYNFVRDEFMKRGINLLSNTEFITLEADEETELISKFRFYCNDTTRTRQKLFMSSFDNFQKIRPELERFKKKGNKIISLSNSLDKKSVISNKKIVIRSLVNGN
ncbi:MAG: hypothetical protein AB1298_02780 [Bacteroidota bacterium]